MKFIAVVFSFSLLSMAYCDETEPKKYLFQGIDKCSASDTKDAFEIKHSWNSPTFSGSINLPMDIDDNITFEAKFYQFKDDDWKERVSMKGKKVCEMLNSPMLKDVWIMIAKQAGVKSDCPIPKGSYQLNDISLNAEDLVAPIFHGKFKVVVNVFNKEKPLFCREIKVQSSDYKM